MEIGLLVSLPLAVGAVGPMATLAAIGRLRRRKAWTAAAAFGQAAVLMTLGGLELGGRLTVPVLILAAATYQICAMAAATAWSSWLGDLVPASMRGRYFSLRSRGVQVAICASLVAAGLVLERLEPAAAGSELGVLGGAGFRVLFPLAAAMRAISAVLLLFTPEGRFHGISGPRQLFRFVSTERGRAAWRLLALGGAFQMVTYMASPYFAPFMLQKLELSYAQYMLATVAVVIGKFTLFPVWGRALDRHGPRSIYSMALLCAALVPLPWLWAGGIGWVLAAQFFSGVSWSGHEVSQFSILLDVSYRRTRPHVFAALNLVHGSAQLVGATLGGLVVTATGGRYRWVFAISLVLRLAVAFSLPRVVPRIGRHGPGRRQLILRAVGWRASGGIAHRPVAIDELDDSEAAP